MVAKGARRVALEGEAVNYRTAKSRRLFTKEQHGKFLTIHQSSRHWPCYPGSALHSQEAVVPVYIGRPLSPDRSFERSGIRL